MADPHVGMCPVCGGGIWEGDDYVIASPTAYHRGCAERLLSELQAAL